MIPSFDRLETRLVLSPTNPLEPPAIAVDPPETIVDDPEAALEQIIDDSIRDASNNLLKEMMERDRHLMPIVPIPEFPPPPPPPPPPTQTWWDAIDEIIKTATESGIPLMHP